MQQEENIAIHFAGAPIQKLSALLCRSGRFPDWQLDDSNGHYLVSLFPHSFSLDAGSGGVCQPTPQFFVNPCGGGAG